MYCNRVCYGSGSIARFVFLILSFKGVSSVFPLRFYCVIVNWMRGYPEILNGFDRSGIFVSIWLFYVLTLKICSMLFGMYRSDCSFGAVDAPLHFC